MKSGWPTISTSRPARVVTGAEGALVDDAPPLAEELKGRRLLLLAGKLGDVDGAGEPLEMPRLVSVAEVEEELAEGVGRSSSKPWLPSQTRRSQRLGLSRL